MALRIEHMWAKLSKGTHVIISDNILETERLNKAKIFFIEISLNLLQ